MKTAAFFDMDGTLLRGESQFSFLLWCVNHRKAPLLPAVRVLTAYAAYLLGKTDDAGELRRAGYALFKGRSAAELEELGRKFFDTRLIRRFREFAPLLVARHRKQGHEVILVTSAVEALARPLAEHLQFDGVIATRLTARDGILTGERELPEPYGPDKKELTARWAARKGYAPEDCYAFTDHVSDAALLEWAGHPVAVNPVPALRGLAFRKGWPLLDLDFGVPREYLDL